MCLPICFSSWFSFFGSSSMHFTTSPLLILLTIINSILFFTDAALSPQHKHGGGGCSCIPDERAALLLFKKGIRSDPNGLLSSWHGRDCCQWRGVTCSNQTGRVLKLQLRSPSVYVSSPFGFDVEDGCGYDSSALSGKISSSLSSLEHLEHVDLSMNCLLGSNSHFPEFLGSMESLRYLNLSGIPFIGRVPPHLGNLSKLQYLDLGSSYGMYSADMTWLKNLRFLRYLSMRAINLSQVADWPHMLNMVPSLQDIRLSGCSLHSADQSLPYLNLTKLENLDLSQNNFNHEIASSWFWKVTTLKNLNIGLNCFSGNFHDSLRNMTSLHVLNLAYNINNCDGTGILWLQGNFKNLFSLKILDLTNNWMNGDISDFMGSLPELAWSKLQELHLSSNGFTGQLPDCIGQYTSLNILDLHVNSITGSIPVGIGNCTSLYILDLSDNKFFGLLPTEIRHLADLNTLRLSNNDLSGVVPELNAFSKLIYLDLSHNNLSGVITEKHFRGAISLKRIDLSDNYLKVLVDAQWLPPFKLESARFASCQMGPIFPAWLQRQFKIDQLDISSTALADEIPDWFWSTISQATYLDISQNQMRGSLPTHLKDMDFQVLNLSSNQLNGPIPQLPRNIIMFDISNNSFSGTLPLNFEAPQLIALAMSSNKIGGNIPQSICKLQSLQYLDLSSNLLEGGVPQCFDSIKSLFLSNNSLSGKFLASLQSNTKMLFLDLSWNKFSGKLPPWIGDMINLQFLQLSHNNFSGNIPTELTSLIFLHYLDLSCNNFSGVVPRNFSNLAGMILGGYQNLDSSPEVAEPVASHFGESIIIDTKGLVLRFGLEVEYFVSIDLSDNYLTGEIPIEITSLDALVNLNLSSNQLSGTIPNKFGALQSLESLDLSRNMLSGEIPTSLANLTSLSYLNLSYNNLSGRIPSGRQLDTLNADNPLIMYIGNSGLCGRPVQKNSPENGTSIHVFHLYNRLEIELMSFYFGLVLGLVVGLWMVFCALLFKKTWRVAYFWLFDEVYDRIFVFVVVKWVRLTGMTGE